MRLRDDVVRNCGAAALLFALAYCGGKSSPPPPTLTITTTALTDGVTTKTYAQTLQATGGTGAYSWSWASSGQAGLPPGLAIDGATGVIGGTPSGTGTYDVSVSVRDSGSPAQRASKNLALNIHQVLTMEGAFPDGHLSYPYNAHLNVTSGILVAWKLKSGTLPPGLSLFTLGGQGIYLHGVPTQAGSFAFTIEIEDGYQHVPLDYTVKIDSAVKILPATLKMGIDRFPYSDSLKAVNGVPPLTWSTTALPFGVVINASTGEISGTPVGSGSGFFDVTVTDSSSPLQSDTASFYLRMIPDLEVGTGPVQFMVGQSAYYSLPVSGGFSPYTFRVSGDLPPGVIAGTRELFGTPTKAGSYSVTVIAQDSLTPPQVASRLINIQVNPRALLMQQCGTPSIRVGQPVSFTPTLLFPGQPPYVWSLHTGVLPSGWTVNPVTGEIGGVATTSGWYDFVIQVEDSASPPQHTRQACAMQVLPDPNLTSGGRNDSLAKATPLYPSLGGGYSVQASISPYSDPVHVAQPDADYYRVMAFAGQTISVEVRADNRALDPVLELLDENGNRFTTCRNAGTTDGLDPDTVDPTPDAFDDVCVNDDRILGKDLNSSLELRVPGTSGTIVPVYIHVLDERGDARPDMTYDIMLSGGLAGLGINNDHLTPTAVGVPYSGQLTTSGGVAPYTFALASGSAPLPPGLTLTTTGQVSGTPTVAGRFVFSVSATDSGTPTQSAVREITLFVAEPMTIVVPDLMPDAFVDVPYALPVRVAGGISPHLWFQPSLQWPRVIAFTGSGFSGIPDNAGTFTGRLGAEMGYTSISKDVTLVVKTGPSSIANQTLMDLTAGDIAYSSMLTALGGTRPYTWTIIGGSLPPALVLDAIRGDIYGRATTAGTYTFTVQVADSGSPQQTATHTFTLNVLGP